MADPILFDCDGAIARITLNRPEVGNAVNIPLARGLLEAAIRCQTDTSIRCVVVTGSGKLFCAGGDVGLMQSAGDQLPAMLSELITPFHMAVTRLAQLPIPVLMLVNGSAAGAGMSLALLGDIVLSARSAHYTAAYGAIGLTADGGLSWLLPRLVGLRKAQDIILTNRRIKADEAHAIGLVTRIVDDAALAAEGAAIADRLADAPTAAFGALRALLRASFESGFQAQLDRELHSMVSAAATAEVKEGLSAFFGKRAADFRGA